MRYLFRAVLVLLIIAASPAMAGNIKHIIVIAMENKDPADIYGSASAPYINGTLLKQGARADNFSDPLPDRWPFSIYLSEPHYIWMEAGTNVFPNHSFRGDGEPSASNLAITGDHLVNQLETKGISWMTYQEGIGPSAKCPIASSGLYAAKHNPFVFFADVAGNPPSAKSPRCIDHTRDLAALDSDLATGRLAQYVFISPNLCNDMHGAGSACKTYRANICKAKPNDPHCAANSPKDQVAFGDAFLKAMLPVLTDWASHNGAAIFIVWDEGSSAVKVPFIAVGAGVKPGYRSGVAYDHGSLIRTVETVFGLPALKTVEQKSDLADLFLPGAYP